MTGSPVFKCKSSLSKMQRFRRRMRVAADTQEQHSSNIDCPLTLRDNLERTYQKSTNSNFSDVNMTIQNEARPNKSICSSLSSFVFPCKKAVKRKLNFDVDDSSDDVSSLQFSNKNISLCGFQSKTSSAVDNRSLAEFCNATLSPNKKRSSYCRSSVSSAVSCRRRLFVESEPPMKKAKLTSPVLCPKTKLRKKEVKLSLKKKFPGVPDSDSARGGLLLNLAFSKYNLSSTKQEEVSVNFLDNMTGCSVKNKDFIQYSEIKKDEFSISHSPVFMAMKKVKRKLNLEDPDGGVMNSSSTSGRNFVVSKVIESPTDISLAKKDLQPESNSIGVADVALEERSISKVAGLSVLRTHSSNFNTIVSNSLNEHSPISGFRKSNKKAIVSASPVVPQPTDPNKSPFSTGERKPMKSYRNDLFKSSKLRSTLKNKIFNLSKGNLQALEENNSATNAIDDCPSMGKGELFHKEENFNEAGKLTTTALKNSQVLDKRYNFKKGCRTKRSLFCDDSVKNKDESNTKMITNRSSQKIKKTHESKPGWQSSTRNHNFCDGDNVNEKALPEYPNSVQECDRRFLRSHMNRFLKDCLVSVEQRSQSRKESPENETCNIFVHSSDTETYECNRYHIAGENYDEKYENAHNSQIIIENSDSQMKFPIIETIDSQEETIHIENVVSQNERNPISVNDSSCSATQNCDLLVHTKHVFHDESETSNSNFVNSSKAAQLKTHDREACENNLKEKRASTNSASYSCIQFAQPLQLNSQQLCNSNALDTARKTKRRKNAPNTLTHRLDKLLNREKSDFRMWEYELSKTKPRTETLDVQSALFCVQKMWKEYSYLILVCNFIQQNSPDVSCELDEIKSLTKSLSNQIIIVLEPEYCPKNLTYSSVFQVLPPWKLLDFGMRNPLLMLKPRKLTIVKKDWNPSTCKDLSLLSASSVAEQTVFCSCEYNSCECLLRGGYQFFIHSLVVSDLSVFNPNDYVGFNHCDFDSLRSGCIRDAMMKHTLFSCKCLNLELQVLHSHRITPQADVSSWYLLCMDSNKNVCCVFRQGLAECVPANTKNDVVYRFNGILPWKAIPPKNVASFLRFINYQDIPDGVNETIHSQSLILFVMSKNCGTVQVVV